jgi:lysophospholipase L1-like esterase
MVLKKWILAFGCLLLLNTLVAQEPFPMWNEVQRFKKQDSVAFPAPNQVLLIGSSSFTIWKDVQSYFPNIPIINRGFGGSSLSDVIRYRYDVIFPYQPKKIFIYCGENDFASSDTVSVTTVTQRFMTLHQLIRAKYPTTPIVYVSMKPSVSRVQLMPKFEAANKAIAEFLKADKHSRYADVYKAMLKPDGTVMDDIFVADRLHMNAKGYAIWQKVLAPFMTP